MFRVWSEHQQSMQGLLRTHVVAVMPIAHAVLLYTPDCIVMSVVYVHIVPIAVRIHRNMPQQFPAAQSVPGLRVCVDNCS